MHGPLRGDDAGVSTLWSFVGVLILVIAIVGVYYGYVVPKFGAPPLRAQTGDQVQVNYIGTFSDTGLVFDTSLQSVATDNASYLKAFMFSWHNWQPLPVTIGAGTVVKGFDLGIQGLAVGDTRTIVVPPSLGYGAADPTKFVVKPLFESVAVRLTMSTADFVSTYKTTAVSGTTVTDPFWGWSATVSVAGSIVTVTNSPYPGEVVHPYGGWNADVVSIDDSANGGIGAILVHHDLDPTMVDRVGDRTGTSVVFVVTAVDLAAGTYTLDFNPPTEGRTLIFQVTMVQINRPV